MKILLDLPINKLIELRGHILSALRTKDLYQSEQAMLIMAEAMEIPILLSEIKLVTPFCERSDFQGPPSAPLSPAAPVPHEGPPESIEPVKSAKNSYNPTHETEFPVTGTCATQCKKKWAVFGDPSAPPDGLKIRIFHLSSVVHNWAYDQLRMLKEQGMLGGASCRQVLAASKPNPDEEKDQAYCLALIFNADLSRKELTTIIALLKQVLGLTRYHLSTLGKGTRSNTYGTYASVLKVDDTIPSV